MGIKCTSSQLVLQNEKIIYTPCYSRNFWATECPIIFLLLIVRYCMRYVHKTNERKVYVPALSNDYDIRIKYKYNC